MKRNKIKNKIIISIAMLLLCAVAFISSVKFMPKLAKNILHEWIVEDISPEEEKTEEDIAPEEEQIEIEYTNDADKDEKIRKAREEYTKKVKEAGAKA